MSHSFEQHPIWIPQYKDLEVWYGEPDKFNVPYKVLMIDTTISLSKIRIECCPLSEKGDYNTFDINDLYLDFFLEIPMNTLIPEIESHISENIEELRREYQEYLLVESQRPLESF